MDNERLIIELQADITELKKSFERIGEMARQQANETNAGLETNESRISGFGQAGKLAWGAIGTAAIATMGAITGAILKMTDEFAQGTGKIQAMTGAIEGEAQKIARAGTKAWSEGWGESMGEVNEASAQMARNLGKSMQGFEEDVIKGTFVLRDTFGVEANETGRAIASMVQNFDMKDPIKAMDILTNTLQGTKGDAGELLDTFWEYAPKINDMGFSAEEFGLILKRASDNGAWSLDKVGDAMKEFSIRAIDGSKNTLEGFQKIGLSADDMAKKFAKGGETAKLAFYETVQGLNSITNPIKREAAGVQLFGTMWEDLGEDVILSMDISKEKIGELDGATQKAGEALSNNLGAKFDAIKRQFMLPFIDENSPIYKGLVDFADFVLSAMPKIQENIEDVVNWVGKLGGAFKKESPSMEQWKRVFETFEPEIDHMILGFIGLKEYAGEVAKSFGMMVQLISTWLAALVEVAGLAIRSVVGSLDSMNEALDRIKKGDFSGAWDSLKDGKDEVVKINEEIVESTKAAWENSGKIINDTNLRSMGELKIVSRAQFDEYKAITKYGLNGVNETYSKEFKKTRLVLDKETGLFVEVVDENTEEMTDKAIENVEELNKETKKELNGLAKDGGKETANLSSNVQKHFVDMKNKNVKITNELCVDVSKEIQSGSKNIDKAWQVTANKFAPTLNGQKGNVNAAGRAIGQEADKGLQSGSSLIVSNFDTRIRQLSPTVSKYNTTMNTTANTLGTNANSGLNTGVSKINSWWGGRWSGLTGAITAQNNPLYNTANTAGGKAKSGLDKVTNGVYGVMSSEFSKLPGAISSYNNPILYSANTAGGKARTGLKSGAGSTSSIGYDVGAGFKGGLEKWSLGTAIANVARTIGNKVKNTWISMFDTNSPSRWAMDIGGFVGEGLAIGLDKTDNDVTRSAVNMASSVQSSLDSIDQNKQIHVGFVMNENELREKLRQTNATATMETHRKQSQVVQLEAKLSGELAPLVQKLEVKIANNVFNQLGGRGLV